MANYLLKEPLVKMPNTTMIGALSYYITQPSDNFQPMNANFGIFNLLRMLKKRKKKAYSRQALKIISQYSEKW